MSPELADRLAALNALDSAMATTDDDAEEEQ